MKKKRVRIVTTPDKDFNFNVYNNFVFRFSYNVQPFNNDITSKKPDNFVHLNAFLYNANEANFKITTLCNRL